MVLTGLFQHIPELMACQPKLLDAFRSGQGFTYDDMGSTNVCATCRLDHLCYSYGHAGTARPFAAAEDVLCLLVLVVEAAPHVHAAGRWVFGCGTSSSSGSARRLRVHPCRCHCLDVPNSLQTRELKLALQAPCSGAVRSGQELLGVRPSVTAITRACSTTDPCA